MINENDLVADVEAVLGRDGLMVRDGKRFTFNAKQLDYACRVARGLCRYDEKGGRAAVNMLQAATGTGKTIGYLVPLMLFAARTGERVAVSTYTRHLQRQVVDDDAQAVVRWVKEVTGVSLKVGLRMGRGNYVSSTAVDRLCSGLAAEDPTAFKEGIAFLRALDAWLLETGADGQPLHSGLFDDFLAQHGNSDGGLPNGVSRAAIALRYDHPEAEQIGYLDMVARSTDMDVLVVNHALLLLNALRWAALLDSPDGRRIAALVCDEADRLPDAAKSVMSEGVSLHNLVRCCAAVDLPMVEEAASRLYDQVRTMRAPEASAAVIEDPSALFGNVRAAMDVLQPAATKAVQSLRDGIGKVDKLAVANFIDEVAQLSRAMSAIGTRNSSAVVSWSPIRMFPSIHVGTPNAARVLSRFWRPLDMVDEAGEELAPPRSYLDAVLLTSATLDVPGRPLPGAFDDIASKVGVIRYPAKGESQPIHNVCTDLYARFEPTAFGKMSFVFADPRVVSPTLVGEEVYETSPEWLDYIASMIRGAHAMGGRAVSLALSWRDTRALAERLQDLERLVVHQQGRPLEEALIPWRNSENGVLLSPGAWEGLNEDFKHLVITRIPFGVPNDATSLIQRVALEAQGLSSDAIASILHNDAEIGMRRRMAQGIGRLIRRKDADGWLWVGDPRFPVPESWRGSIDDVILSGLPHFQRPALRTCIPARFRETTYQKAKVWLKEGILYDIVNEEAA